MKMHRNPHYFKGPDFEEKILKAQEEHAKVVAELKSKVFWKEPSQHDIMYSFSNETGQRLFYPSAVPAEPGLGAPEPEDIADRIRRQVQGQAMLQLARELGAETFEEANDFNVDPQQDLCPFSGHEYDEQDEVAVLKEHERLVKLKEEREEAEKKRLKMEDYKRMKEEFEASAPPVATASDTSDSG